MHDVHVHDSWRDVFRAIVRSFCSLVGAAVAVSTLGCG